VCGPRQATEHGARCILCSTLGPLACPLCFAAKTHRKRHFTLGQQHHQHQHEALACSQPRTACTLPPTVRHLYVHLPIAEPALPPQDILQALSSPLASYLTPLGTARDAVARHSPPFQLGWRLFTIGSSGVHAASKSLSILRGFTVPRQLLVCRPSGKEAHLAKNIVSSCSV
jgi:hypothetical protein